MMPRIYLLDDREINSSKVAGFLHKARTPRGDCMACGEPVGVDDQYVLLNVFSCPDPLHLSCFLADHKDMILGVSVRKGQRYGVPRTFVICMDYGSKTK